MSNAKRKTMRIELPREHVKKLQAVARKLNGGGRYHFTDSEVLEAILRDAIARGVTFDTRPRVIETSGPDLPGRELTTVPTGPEIAAEVRAILARIQGPNVNLVHDLSSYIIRVRNCAMKRHEPAF